MIITKNNNVARSFNNVFDEFFNTLPYGAYNWSKDFKNDSTNVPVNITETAEGYLLEVSAPGRNKEDFKLNVDKGLLTITFEQKAEAENKENKTVRKEFSVASFKRSFSIDEKINADNIEAHYENGILKVTLPKKEEVKISPKQIQIQ